MRTILSNQKPIYKQIRDGFWFFFFHSFLSLLSKRDKLYLLIVLEASIQHFICLKTQFSHSFPFVSFHNSNILMSFSKVLSSWHVASDFVWASSLYLYLFLSLFFHTNSFDINNKRETAECCCQGESFIQDHRDSFTCHYGHIVRKAIGRGEHLEI